MWCRSCNIETNDTVCPICGTNTVEDIPTEVYWCSHCCTPIIQEENQIDKGICPICSRETKYMAKDLRPVFPQERLLLEILLGKTPHEFIEQSVWAADSRYYINGKSISLASKLFQEADADAVSRQLEIHQPNNSELYFEHHISTFIEANANRLHYLKDEANDFIHKAVQGFDEDHIVLSFSGGKDSTATADVVIKALGNPSLVHIFGNTTLEFPLT